MSAATPGSAAGHRGFTLLEVLLALVLATLGVTYLYQALAVSLAAQERQRFYQRCSWFLETELEAKLSRVLAPGTSLGGTLGTGWPQIDYTLSSEESREVKGLIVATVTFTSSGTHSPHTATLKTYLSPRLKTRKPEAQGGGS